MLLLVDCLLLCRCLPIPRGREPHGGEDHREDQGLGQQV